GGTGGGTSCTGSSCSVHGTCIDTTGSPVCMCDAGYTDATCSSCSDGYVSDGGGGGMPSPDIVSIPDTHATTLTAGAVARLAPGYHFVVYIGRGGGFPTTHSATFDLTIGTQATLSGSVMPTFDGTWNPLAGGGDQGNYYVGTTQTADTITITIVATGNAALPT